MPAKKSKNRYIYETAIYTNYMYSCYKQPYLNQFHIIYKYKLERVARQLLMHCHLVGLV